MWWAGRFALSVASTKQHEQRELLQQWVVRGMCTRSVRRGMVCRRPGVGFPEQGQQRDEEHGIQRQCEVQVFNECRREGARTQHDRHPVSVRGSRIYTHDSPLFNVVKRVQAFGPCDTLRARARTPWAPRGYIFECACIVVSRAHAGGCGAYHPLAERDGHGQLHFIPPARLSSVAP